MSNSEEDALRLQLRSMRRDIPPATDLWPGIAARLQRDVPVIQSLPSRVRGVLPFAMAASLLLAAGVAWNGGMHTASPPLIEREALAMASQYEAVLAQYQALPLQPELQPALQDLDRSSARIMSAIERYPDARFLLDQLRRTYDRRLELTQRAIITT